MAKMVMQNLRIDEDNESPDDAEYEVEIDNGIIFKPRDTLENF